MQFTDTSVSTGTTTYEWDINNDGVVDSTVKNPSLTYTIAGTKTVKLTVKNASGSDTEVKTGYITVSLPATKNPKAKFTASGTKGVKPMIVQFTDQSESTGTTTYEWDVNNDGVVESTVKNPSITYTIPGTKTVKLTVKNASGSDSEVKTNYITVSSPTGTTSPAITVTSPNGGETWKRGTTQTVTWNYAGSAGSTVKLVLLKGSTVIGTIKDSVSIGSGGKGSYSWPIALSGTGGTGTGYKVSIQSTSQPTVKDTSNNYFTLSPGTTTVSGSVVIGGDPVVTVRSGN